MISSHPVTVSIPEHCKRFLQHCLSYCINFWQPFNLVVIPQRYPSQKTHAARETGRANPPQWFRDRLVSPSGVVNMAGSCQPASTKTGWSHMSRGEKNESENRELLYSTVSERKGQASGVGPLPAALPPLTLMQQRSGCLEFNHL